MKSISSLIGWIFFLFFFICNGKLSRAQSCESGTYVYPQYSVAKDTGLVYGVSPGFNQQPVTLKMDVYYPVGDTNCYRPLLVWIHGGGFIEGSYRGGLAQNVCDSFAQRGYVVASISYRLGYYREHDWFLGQFAYPYGYDSKELPRAIFRAMQDAKGAIRYLKGLANNYYIDTNNVFAGGESAGAFTALHTAYVNQPQEKFAGCDSTTNVYWYDLFNNVIFSAIRPDLGSIEGTLNLNGTSSKVKGVLNAYGAILDTSLIQTASDPALFQYYIHQDPIVYCYAAKAYYQVAGLYYPFSGITKHPIVYGPCLVSERATNLGFISKRNQTFYQNPDFVNIIPHTMQIGFFMQRATRFLDSLICEGCQPPMLSQAFFDTIVCEDSIVNFTISAGGRCIQYQWMKDGVALAGEVMDSFKIDYASMSDTGWYTCIYSEGCGVDTLQPFHLDVLKSTQLNYQSADTLIDEGDSLEILVLAEGHHLYFQWFKNGNILPGDTFSYLTFYPINMIDSGRYECFITGSCGSLMVPPIQVSVSPVSGLNKPEVPEIRPYIVNPVGDFVQVVFNSMFELASIQIIDISGKILHDQSNQINIGEVLTIESEILNPGYYILLIVSQNNMSYALPFIKN